MYKAQTIQFKMNKYANIKQRFKRDSKNRDLIYNHIF